MLAKERRDVIEHFLKSTSGTSCQRRDDPTCVIQDCMRVS